jgi:histidine triad (HIT) family protein
VSEPCPFCEIIAGRAPVTILREWSDALAIKPRGGVNDGHTLVIPRIHVTDAVVDPDVSADTMRRACQYARDLGNLNIITSVGPKATQTVYHLHLHIVPRTKNDGLPLPWTPQQETARTAGAR